MGNKKKKVAHYGGHFFFHEAFFGSVYITNIYTRVLEVWRCLVGERASVYGLSSGIYFVSPSHRVGAGDEAYESLL